jgi:hypothetical protein
VFGEAPAVVAEKGGRVVDEAAEFLVGFLGDEAVAVSEVLAAGMEAGFSEISLKRARVMLGVKTKKVGSGWGWRLGTEENN